MKIKSNLHAYTKVFSFRLKDASERAMPFSSSSVRENSFKIKSLSGNFFPISQSTLLRVAYARTRAQTQTHKRWTEAVATLVVMAPLFSFIYKIFFSLQRTQTNFVFINVVYAYSANAAAFLGPNF